MAEQPIRACLITNPKSGRGGVDLAEPLSVLWANGWEVDVRQKLHGGHATELARDAAHAGCNVVVDCGGDGTLSEIVEGLVGTDVAVGNLPGGTANLWAHEMGISANLRVAALQLVSAGRHRIDVGQVAVNGKHQQHFVLMAGLGFDGAIISQVNKTLKNRIGPAAIGLAALRALPEARAVPVRVEMDGLRWQGRVSQVIVGNSRRYAGFTQVTRDAFLDDGLLDVCLFSANNPLAAGRQLGSLLLRQRPSASSAETYRTAAITLRAPRVLPLQVDGGAVKLAEDDLTDGGVVYAFTVVAQGITVLVPRTYDGALFQPSHSSDRLADIRLRDVSKAGTDRAGGQGDAAGASAAPAANGKNGKNGKKGHHPRERTWPARVLAVGTDAFAAARLKNGRVVRVELDAASVLAGADGQEQPLARGLATLVAGERITLRGQRNGDKHTLLARRVERAGEPPAATDPDAPAAEHSGADDGKRAKGERRGKRHKPET
jgi:YegS/Rv2252/BmrU family lipid kinase